MSLSEINRATWRLSRSHQAVVNELVPLCLSAKLVDVLVEAFLFAFMFSFVFFLFLTCVVTHTAGGYKQNRDQFYLNVLRILHLKFREPLQRSHGVIRDLRKLRQLKRQSRERKLGGDRITTSTSCRSNSKRSIYILRSCLHSMYMYKKKNTRHVYSQTRDQDSSLV